MRFESKRDPWLLWTIRMLPFAVLAIVGFADYQNHANLRGPMAGLVVIVVMELAVMEPIMRSTYYAIEGDTLLIRSGFIRWRVPIREIRSIEPTRSLLSSPALSLDRLRIAYGGWKAVMVSPEQKERFIEALRTINPSIVA
jgi:hypothetical protein